MIITDTDSWLEYTYIYIYIYGPGTQGHAGQVQMRYRRDAVTALAEIVLKIESLCKHHDLVEKEMLVCTVAEVYVMPNVVNVISGDVTFTTDLRSLSDTLIDDIVESVIEIIDSVTQKRRLTYEIVKDRPKMPPVLMSDSISAQLVAAGEEAHLTSKLIWGDNVYNSNTTTNKNPRVPILPSGAGHDAMEMITVTPNVGMLWVRCLDGVSHSPLEFVAERDVSEGAMALYHYLKNDLLKKSNDDGDSSSTQGSGGSSMNDMTLSS